MLHGPNIAKRFQLLYALTLTKIIRKQIALDTHTANFIKTMDDMSNKRDRIKAL